MIGRAFLILTLGLLGLAGSSDALSSQNVAELLASIRNGGGWVGIPIESGRGTLKTGVLPTIGIRISGCAQVWIGHSGHWDIRARDTQGEGLLEMSTPGGVGVPFTYTTGFTAQLDVDVEWSEPRDTTLLLWVGLEGPGREGPAVCEPEYAAREQGGRPADGGERRPSLDSARPAERD